MNFGERLKQLREEYSITQKHLANVIHVQRPAISGYETKFQQPDYERLCTIADFFDVSIDYLLGRTDIRKPLSPVISEDIPKFYELYNKLTYRNQIALQERARILIEQQAKKNSLHERNKA